MWAIGIWREIQRATARITPARTRRAQFCRARSRAMDKKRQLVSPAGGF
jgi:hypothetical protein